MSYPEAPYSSSRLHDPSQPPPVPGTTTNNNTNDVPISQSTDPRVDQDAPTLPRRTQAEDVPTSQGRDASNSGRPLGVPTPSDGDFTMRGQSGLPLGQPTTSDKIIGKTEKVIGKALNDREMLERGELRETGGKAAAESRARAAYD